MKHILLSAFAFVSLSVFGQGWQQTQGPYAGYTTAMTTVGDYIYASNRYYGQGDGRVYRSSDFGENWVPADNGMPPDLNFVQQFANIGEIILAAANHLYKTTNQGDLWQIKEDGLPVQAISIEAIGNEFWAGTNGAGIYKSTNFGESYTSMNTGILWDAGTVIVYDIAFHNGNIFLATEGGGGPARLYRSSNMGASWELANNGLPLGTNPHHFAINGNTLFVSSDGDFAQYEYGLYKSDDNGNTWTPCNNGIPVILNGNTGKIFAHDGVVYASTTFPDGSPKVYKSTNNGESFTPASSGLRNQNQQAYSYTAAGNYVFAGMGWYASVFRTGNQGETWEESRKGLANSATFSLMEHGGRLYAGAQEGLFYSEDLGETWTEMQNGLPFGRPIVTMEKNGTNIYLGTDQFGIYRSTDSGNSWSQINNGLTGVFAEYIEDIHYFNGALFAATWDGIYKSTNNGDTWTLSSNGLPGEFGGSLVSVNTITDLNGVLFAGTVLEGVFKSTDMGQTWTDSGSGLSTYAQTVHQIVTAGNSMIAGTESGIYKSVDQGSTWQLNPALNEGFFRTVANTGGAIYASVYGPTVLTGYNVFKSIDEGNTWTEFNQGMNEDSRVRDFLYHGGQLFSATDTRSVWRSGAPLTTIAHDANNLTVHPNPSGGQFWLTFEPDSGTADVAVHNLLGQKVLDAVHSGGPISIDLTSQQPGIYLLTLKSNSQTLTQKLVKQ